MPLGVDINVYGAGQSASAMRRIGARGADMRPAMSAIRELLIEGNRRQFETSGGFLGEPWERLAPGTVARKARMGQEATPMVATGALRESLEGGRGKRSRVTRSSVMVGTSLFYAIFHIKGTSKGVPARPPLGIADSERVAALELIHRFLTGGMR